MPNSGNNGRRQGGLSLQEKSFQDRGASVGRQEPVALPPQRQNGTAELGQFGKSPKMIKPIPFSQGIAVKEGQERPGIKGGQTIQSVDVGDGQSEPTFFSPKLQAPGQGLFRLSSLGRRRSPSGRLHSLDQLRPRLVGPI